MLTTDLLHRTLHFAFILSAILISGCQSDMEPIDCYEIGVIGGEQCTLGTLVSIKNLKNVGETIQYYDGITYKNVVRIYSEVSIPRASKGFIQFREFDREKDRELRDSYAAICLAILAPYPVPTIVATFWSEEPC
ncbi:MAG: hypothetical protein Q8S14_17560 [Algoriphagus sp.]|uniref:hypothetical protein n=1 Tax=Algoriphagus sp. TaxID=1872435 RepID=UPI00271EBA8D|nr:hypothetical protein [Algoriphagus sp.]MDO8968118.1 hypothetical protein [Algoriphagus sp.]MDP2043045.1 hypothetical protein [Algoriphagus sp.]MDP3202219.1 hypothetical protein [Algoriphagus sp.]MDP3473682.1 hypothetical protein [Algoriphagus sp.]